MINSVEFTERLKKVMEHHQLSASTFADKVGVQRSSISHILSGRNKPSLDFILKVTSEFSDVDIHWLLNGKGNYPKIRNSGTTPPSSLFEDSNTVSGKKIQRIVVFYDDGTFDEYQK
ncbi:helix-turn-helix transcriptional regulator [Polaribacter batillariae]|uniref:Helix-turn-helix transcriptional regulator n=1 Tax=Polaribacter batillariae TaxID=2808900 RepID=A0ABX7SXE8_9FLAO|nr:helix-turn-helix transcriptional regulator [Polaribacter batillariae]QTD37935.1 helix-turn-helix transcriptional regulator [Polaribacter batillariae]